MQKTDTTTATHSGNYYTVSTARAAENQKPMNEKNPPKWVFLFKQ